MTHRVLTKRKEYNMEITKFENKCSKLYFDMVDLKATIDAHKLRDIKRVHDGIDNQDTIGDLIDDVMESIEELQNESIS